jgi:hypothetical protein
MGYLDTKSSTGITDFASQLSGYNHAGYDTLWTHAKDDYCSDFEHYSDKVRGSETCKSLDEYSTLVKEYCSTGDNITTTSCGDTEVVGSVIFNELAEAYCVANPDKEFCKCYNVVNYETVCANRPTSMGCAKAKEVYDKYIKYEIPDPNVWLPCGNFCKGVNNYRPPGHDAGCSGTIAACIQNIEVGAAHDEINAACEINTGDANELTSGSSGGSSGSGGSGTVPTSVSTSAVDELKKTIAEDKKKQEEEAKKTNKNLLIGGGGGGIVSSISCLVLLVIIVMVMSKKGGGGRR